MGREPLEKPSGHLGPSDIARRLIVSELWVMFGVDELGGDGQRARERGKKGAFEMPARSEKAMALGLGRARRARAGSALLCCRA